MRNVSFAVRVLVAVAVFSVSAVGQQPTVLLYPSTSIDLPVEPARAPHVMTLADAARHNDFPTFDALYSVAPSRDAAAYREFYSFWKWSLTDPVGAFYSDEVHAKLAREYPDYAEYIADFGIIDSHGRAYYPSAETRTFLLKKAESGRVAVVAESGGRAPLPVRVTTKPKPVVVAKKKPTATPVVEAPKPVVITHAKPIYVTKVVEQPAAKVVEQPKAEARQARAPVLHNETRPRPHVRPASDARLGRGLMLIIAGLVALGMLSLMFSTPGEEEAAHEQSTQHPVERMRIIPLDEKPKKTA